ncbi:MAG: dephospho-CoA kinase [Solirubrobacterales bacterium]|nr:dephospho-CoA kinase [Solirubrobacterales bacterium]MBV9798414.1 dephospho-CoA kinase [Solirubrobacterales bacterium]
MGLTGGIGAGKSTALEALSRLGAAVLSTDRVVHELYESREVRQAVAERFGEAVAPGTTVDRAALAARAFSTGYDRAWLEGLLWPRVGARVADWREQLERASPRPRAAVVEVPLLFEAEMDGAFDATIAIVADEALRAQRAGGRGHEALEERAARQLTQHEKAQRATFVVVNDGTVAGLESKLSAVLEKLTR